MGVDRKEVDRLVEDAAKKALHETIKKEVRKRVLKRTVIVRAAIDKYLKSTQFRRDAAKGIKEYFSGWLQDEPDSLVGSATWNKFIKKINKVIGRALLRCVR